MNIIKCVKDAFKETILVIISLAVLIIVFAPFAIGILSNNMLYAFIGLVITLFIIIFLAKINDMYGDWLLDFLNKIFGEEND